jgi:hypothetical protein
MPVQVLVDNDIVIKLAQFDAFEEALALLGHAIGEAGTTKAARFQMGLRNPARRLRLTNGSQPAADRLGAIVGRLAGVETDPAEAALSAQIVKIALEASLDIDAGEAMLLSMLICRGARWFQTGDKRAIRSLPAAEARVPAIVPAKQRIVCLEQIIKGLLAAHGFPWVAARINAAPAADTGITLKLGRAQNDAGRFTTFVNGAIRNLSQQAPGWLSPL